MPYIINEKGKNINETHSRTSIKHFISTHVAVSLTFILNMVINCLRNILGFYVFVGYISCITIQIRLHPHYDEVVLRFCVHYVHVGGGCYRRQRRIGITRLQC